MRVLGGSGVNEGHHGLLVGLSPGHAFLCRCQHAGGQRNGSIGDHRPVRDQQGPAARVKECLRQSREALCTRGAVRRGRITRRHNNPVRIELSGSDTAAGLAGCQNR